MHRVLVAGGIAWLSGLRGDVSNAETNGYVRANMSMKGLNAFMIGMTFKKMLRKRAYTKEALLEFIARTRFGVVANQSGPLELSVTLPKRDGV